MSLAFWRDLAIIFLAVEAMILLIFLLVPFYFAVRGLNAVHVRLPGYFAKAQGISRNVRVKTAGASEHVSAPLLRAQRGATKAEAAAHILLTDRPHKQ